MKKILFLLGMYQPRPSANGICVENIINNLINNGYSVDCVVNRESRSENEEVYNDCNVYRIKTRLVYRLTEWCEYNGSSKLKPLVKALSTILNKIKLIMFSPIWPIVSPLYTHRFYKKAKQLHEKNHYDIVIGVYTPIDSLYAAYLLKKKFENIKFVPYFLDSLSGGYGPRNFSAEKTRKRGLKLENKLLGNADRIVIMKSSEEHHRKYNTDKLEKFRVLDIPLLSYKKKTGRICNDDGFRLVFIGSIQKSIRNPDFMISMLEALSSFNIRVTFAGDIDCMERFDVLKSKYQDRIVFLGRIPHEDALDLMANADALLNIGNSNPLMVPSKIFEYMSNLKPVISTLPIADEPSAVYLSRYPMALLVDEHRTDFDVFPQEILRFLNRVQNVSVSYDDLQKLFYNNTPEAFADVLNKID